MATNPEEDEDDDRIPGSTDADYVPTGEPDNSEPVIKGPQDISIQPGPLPSDSQTTPKSPAPAPSTTATPTTPPAPDPTQVEAKPETLQPPVYHTLPDDPGFDDQRLAEWERYSKAQSAYDARIKAQAEREQYAARREQNNQAARLTSQKYGLQYHDEGGLQTPTIDPVTGVQAVKEVSTPVQYDENGDPYKVTYNPDGAAPDVITNPDGTTSIAPKKVISNPDKDAKWGPNPNDPTDNNFYQYRQFGPWKSIPKDDALSSPDPQVALPAAKCFHKQEFRDVVNQRTALALKIADLSRLIAPDDTDNTSSGDDSIESMTTGVPTSIPKGGLTPKARLAIQANIDVNQTGKPEPAPVVGWNGVQNVEATNQAKAAWQAVEDQRIETLSQAQKLLDTDDQIKDAKSQMLDLSKRALELKKMGPAGYLQDQRKRIAGQLENQPPEQAQQSIEAASNDLNQTDAQLQQQSQSIQSRMAALNDARKNGGTAAQFAEWDKEQASIQNDQDAYNAAIAQRNQRAQQIQSGVVALQAKKAQQVQEQRNQLRQDPTTSPFADQLDQLDADEKARKADLDQTNFPDDMTKQEAFQAMQKDISGKRQAIIDGLQTAQVQKSQDTNAVGPVQNPAQPATFTNPDGTNTTLPTVGPDGREQTPQQAIARAGAPHSNIPLKDELTRRALELEAMPPEDKAKQLTAALHGVGRGSASLASGLALSGSLEGPNAAISGLTGPAFPVTMGALNAIEFLGGAAFGNKAHDALMAGARMLFPENVQYIDAAAQQYPRTESIGENLPMAGQGIYSARNLVKMAMAEPTLQDGALLIGKKLLGGAIAGAGFEGVARPVFDKVVNAASSALTGNPEDPVHMPTLNSMVENMGWGAILTGCHDSGVSREEVKKIMAATPTDVLQNIRNSPDLQSQFKYNPKWIDLELQKRDAGSSSPPPSGIKVNPEDQVLVDKELSKLSSTDHASLTAARDQHLADLQVPEYANNPDRKAQIQAQIDDFNKELEVNPHNIEAESRPTLARALLKVSQGTPLDEVEQAVVQKAKTKSGVAFVDEHQGQPIITDTAKQWLEKVAPKTASLIGATGDEARANVEQQQAAANPPAQETPAPKEKAPDTPKEPSVSQEPEPEAPPAQEPKEPVALKPTTKRGEKLSKVLQSQGVDKRVSDHYAATKENEYPQNETVAKSAQRILEDFEKDGGKFPNRQGAYNDDPNAILASNPLYTPEEVQKQVADAKAANQQAINSAHEGNQKLIPPPRPEIRELTPDEENQAQARSGLLQRYGVKKDVADAFARQHIRDGKDQKEIIKDFNAAGGIKEQDRIGKTILTAEGLNGKNVDELTQKAAEAFKKKNGRDLTDEERGKLSQAIQHLAPAIARWKKAFKDVLVKANGFNSAGVSVDVKTHDLRLSVEDLLASGNLKSLINHPDRPELLLREEASHIFILQAIKDIAAKTGQSHGQLAEDIFNSLPERVKRDVRDAYDLNQGDNHSNWTLGHEFLRMVLQRKIAFEGNSIRTGAIITEQTAPRHILLKIKEAVRRVLNYMQNLSENLKRDGVDQKTIDQIQEVTDNAWKALQDMKGQVDSERDQQYGKNYGSSTSEPGSDGQGIRSGAIALSDAEGSGIHGISGELPTGEDGEGPAGNPVPNGNKKPSGPAGGGVAGRILPVADETLSGRGNQTGGGTTDPELEKRLNQLEAEKAEAQAVKDRAQERRNFAVQKKAENTADKEKVLAKVPDDAKTQATEVLSKVQMGSPDYVLGANRERIPCVRIAAPPAEVQTSHIGEDFQKNPNYGGENTRPYHSDETEQNKVRQMALPGALDEDSLVTDHKSADAGAPQVVLAIFNDAEGKPQVRLQTAGGNGREMGTNLAPLEDQERLSDAWKAKEGNFGLKDMPEGWRGYRFLGVYDLRDEGQNRQYQQLVDKLNPSSGVVQDTAARADIDAALKIPVERIADLPLTMSPDTAKTALVGLIKDSEKLGLDRNLMAGLVKNPTQAQFYMQRLLLAAAFRSKALGDFFTSAQLSSGHATVSGLIKAATSTALKLREIGHGNTADAIGRLLERVSEYVKGGDKIGVAIRRAADQTEMGPDGPTTNMLADALNKKIAYHPQNKKGIKPVDSDETVAGFESLMGDLSTAISHHSDEGDMFGESRTVGDTLQAGINSHFRRNQSTEMPEENGDSLNARSIPDPTKRMRDLFRKRQDEGLNRYETEELTNLEKQAGQHFMGFFDETRKNDFALEQESEARGLPKPPAEQMALLSRQIPDERKSAINAINDAVGSKKAEREQEQEKKFSDAVEEAASGKGDLTKPIDAGDTPPVLLATGADPLPMIMPRSVVIKATEGYHGLPLDAVKQVTKAIKDPIFVFDSATVPDAQTAILDIQHEGKNILVAVHYNEFEKNHEINRIASVYDKTNGTLIRWMRDGLLRYINTRKSREWSRSRGLQLPKEATPRGNSKLKTEADLVNGQNSESLNARRIPDDNQMDLFSDAKPEIKAYKESLEKEGITDPVAQARAAMDDLKLTAPQALDLAQEKQLPTDLFGKTKINPDEINDFGEKISGAKKDLWQRNMDAIRAKLPDDIREITLSKHFPEPDYERLIEEGADKNRVAAMKAIRDMIPRKPTAGYKLRRWGELVKSLHETLGQIVSPESEVSNEKLEEIFSKSPKIRNAVALYRDLGFPACLHAKDWNVEQGNGVSIWNGQKIKPGEVVTYAEHKDRWRTDIFSTNPNQAEAFKEVAAKIKEQIEREQLAAGDQPAQSRQTKFDVYHDRKEGKYFIGRKGLTSILRIKTGFETSKDAFNYIKDNRKEIEGRWHDMKWQPTGRKEINDPREGKPHRDGDVIPSQFSEAFGFRGVQFGNYVEGERRQQDLNHSFDALMDLSEALGIPTKALSLDGSLGLAFGARGTGSALAHYEPGEVAINLTKSGGPGCLAHEWFHALDHYFSKLDETGTTDWNKGSRGYASDSRQAPSNVRPEVWEAFKRIAKELDKGGFAERSRQLDETRTKPYWGTTIEKAARAFEMYVKERLANSGIRDDYLANISHDGGAYPTEQELRDGIGPAFDHLFETLDTKQTDKGTALYSRKIEDEENPDRQPADSAKGPDDQTDKSEAQKTLESSMSELPQKMQEALRGHFSGKSEPEVADEMGVTQQAVKQLQKAGLNRLRAKLTENGIEKPDDILSSSLNAPRIPDENEQDGTDDLLKSIPNTDKADNMDRINDLKKQADAEENSGQEKKIGRPDLAHGADSPEIRAIDQAYTENMDPVKMAEEAEKGRALVDNDAAGTAARIISKGLSGKPLDTAAEVFAAKIIKSKLQAEAAKGTPGAWEKLASFWTAYRETGATQARTFSARQDPTLSPADRNRSFLLDKIAEPSKALKELIEKGGDPGKIKVMLDKETAEVLAKLKKAGITPEDILKDRVAYRPIDKKILNDFRSLLSRAIGNSDMRKAAFDMILKNKGFDEISKATGIPENAVRKIKEQFIDKMRQDNFSKFQSGVFKAEGEGTTGGKPLAKEAAEKEFQKWLAKLGVVPDAEQGKKAFDIENPAHVKRMYAAIQEAKGESTLKDKILEFWKSSLLTAPKTLFSIGTSNLASVTLDSTLQRGMEQMVNVAFRDPKAAQFGEMKYFAKAFTGSLSRAFDIANRSWSAEHDFSQSTLLGTPDEMNVRSGWGTTQHIKGPVGKLVRIGGRSILWMDQMSKDVFAGMEVAARAYRIAKAEGLKGDAIADRVAQLSKTRGDIIREYSQANPPPMDVVRAYAKTIATARDGVEPEDLIDDRSSDAWTAAREYSAEEAAKKDGWTPQAWEEAFDHARATTFKQDLKSHDEGDNWWVEHIGTVLQEEARKGNPIANVFAPFVRTPYNIARIGIRKSPLGTANLLWQAGKAGIASLRDYKAEDRTDEDPTHKELYLNAHPTAVRDLAEQIMAWGTTALLYGAVQGDKNDDDKKFLITGSPEEMGKDTGGIRALNERATGGGYQIRIGGRNGISIPYGRVEPLVTCLGTAADMIRASKRKGTTEDNFNAFYNFMLGQAKSKSYLTGLSNLSEMLDGRQNPTLLRKTVLQAIPNLIREPMRSSDDYVRDQKTAPWWHDAAPGAAGAEPLINAYGKPVMKAGNWFERLFVNTPLATDEKLRDSDKLLLNWNHDNPSQAWAPDAPKEIFKGLDGKEQHMTGPEATKFRTVAGRIASNQLKAVVNARNIEHPTFQDIQNIKRIFENAGEQAKTMIFNPGYLSRRNKP